MTSSNYDEIVMHDKFQFADSLKDLRNLRNQLYSAAEHLESSYYKDDYKQLVVESTKDYVAKAIVSTVDHLGSVADKLNKFLDEKANEFSSTNFRFSCIEQRLNTSRRLIDLRGISQDSLLTIDAPKHHKRYIIPAEQSFHLDKSNVSWRNCISCPQNHIYQANHVNAFFVAFRAARLKPQPSSLLRKGYSRMASSESSSPKPPNFSFTTSLISNKDTGKRSVSPLRFALKRSGTVASRSASPTPSVDKQQSPSEPRRAIVPLTSKDREVESYAKKSKHLFKALLSIHQSKKAIAHDRFYREA